MLIILTVWIVAVVLAGILAQSKNRSVGGWIIGTLFLSPLMVLILLALPSTVKEEKTKEEKSWGKASVAQCPHCMKYQDAPSPDKNKKCPFCAEEIKIEAILCKHCGKDVPAYEAPVTFVCKFCGQDIPIPEIKD